METGSVELVLTTDRKVERSAAEKGLATSNWSRKRTERARGCSPAAAGPRTADRHRIAPPAESSPQRRSEAAAIGRQGSAERRYGMVIVSRPVRLNVLIRFPRLHAPYFEHGRCSRKFNDGV